VHVTECASRVVHVPLSRPYRIAYREIRSVDLVLLKVRTDRSIEGLGCASPASFVTGETVQACAKALSAENLEWLAGADIRQLPRLLRLASERMNQTPAARAALDMALYDCYGKLLDVPVAEALGRAHRALPTSVTVGICSQEETIAQIEDFLQRGFKVIKVKIGKSLQEDIARLRRVREKFGSEIGLRVDANQGYSIPETEAFLEETSDLDLELLEQPLAASDIDGLRSLPPGMRARIAADESLKNESDALRLIRPDPACGVFNIKLMKCGGISAACRIALLAELSGLSLMWGCMDESVISIAAALHAALSCPATAYLDLDGSLDLERDVAEGGFTIENGFLHLTDRPGLGVRLLEG